MGVPPQVDSDAFEAWPDRLRAMGYEVELDVSDDELALATVRKGWRKVDVALPRHPDGTADVFVKGLCWRRREFVKDMLKAMDTPVDGR